MSSILGSTVGDAAAFDLSILLQVTAINRFTISDFDVIVLQSETGSLTRVSTSVYAHVTLGKVSHSLVAHVCAHTNTHSDIHNTQTPDKHIREKIVECIRMDTGH